MNPDVVKTNRVERIKPGMLLILITDFRINYHVLLYTFGLWADLETVANKRAD